MRHNERRELKLTGDHADSFFNGLLDEAVQSRERFVEQQNARLENERSGDGHALLLTAGKFVDALVQMLSQSQKINQFIDFLGSGCGRVVAKTVDDVVVGVQVREQRKVLEHDVEAALLHRHIREVLAVEHNFARGSLRQAENQIQKRRFAAARRTEDGDNFPFSNGERNVRKDGSISVALVDAFEGEHFLAS